MAVQIVRVEGLRETQRALRKMGNGIDSGFKTEAKAIAEGVARVARARVPVNTGRARDSIKAGAQMKGAYVQGGKKAVPYYGWLDFGSRTPRKGRPRSVGPWRGSGKGPRDGRFIYPALAEKRHEVEDRTIKLVKRSRKQAGL